MFLSYQNKTLDQTKKLRTRPESLKAMRRNIFQRFANAKSLYVRKIPNQYHTAPRICRKVSKTALDTKVQEVVRRRVQRSEVAHCLHLKIKL